MKNKLTDLNNHLFAQIERLGDEDLKGENLEKEIIRTEAISKVSTQIVNNARLCLEAHKVLDGVAWKAPEMLGVIAQNPKEIEE